MYPNLYYAFRDLFGVEWTGLHFINSFGFFVAISFLAAASVLTNELRRKGKLGLLTYEEEKIVIGKPASASELLSNFILGFILGYKIIGLFVSDSPLAANAQEFIFSSEGSWGAGILIGCLLALVKWWEKNKQKLSKPEERTIRIWPHDRVGTLVVLALIFGLVGAKIFDNLENWDRFIKDPIGELLSFSGLTFYGGLICATLAIWWYAKKHKIGFWHLNDAAAPTLMLAYAIGRIGCQVAGDGDWGIYNSAYAVDQYSNITLAEPGQFQKTLEANTNFFLREHETLNEVPRKEFKKPAALSFLPTWFFAYDYPHNVISQGVPIANCTDQNYCNHLPAPVFPTPFYELIMGLLLFLLLWSLRKKLKIPGQLFAIYLIVNGLERFLIEKIRVNTKYENLPFQPTQAELISSFLVLSGVLLLIWLKKKKTAAPPAVNATL